MAGTLILLFCLTMVPLIHGDDNKPSSPPTHLPTIPPSHAPTPETPYPTPITFQPKQFGVDNPDDDESTSRKDERNFAAGTMRRSESLPRFPKNEALPCFSKTEKNKEIKIYFSVSFSVKMIWKI